MRNDHGSQRFLRMSLTYGVIAWWTIAHGQTIDKIRKAVAANMAQLSSFHCEARVSYPNLYDPSEPDASNVAQQIVEFTTLENGKARIAHLFIYPSDAERYQLDTLEVYNGNIGLSVGFDEFATQTAGAVLTDRDVTSILKNDAFADCEFGRASGARIDGRPLTEWLAEPSARVIEQRDVGSMPCVVVAVAHLEFAFSLEQGFALKRYDGKWSDGELALSIENDTLSEVKSGLWVPTSGKVDVHHRGKSYNFEVLELEIDPKVADSQFTIQFDPGLKVIDRRFHTVFLWREGTIVGSTPDWIAEAGLDTVLEDESVVSVSGEKISNSPAAQQYRVVGAAIFVFGGIVVVLACAARLFVWCRRRRNALD